ncbi:MAG: nicotinate-nucleotide adenylyltransferase [Bacteroidales bacterium]|nr:nicotinate-nucleotide adenylyltransferase [Bacteroidales bacterium]
MRIGIFGGTFDPPHLGHLILAEQCREDARLDAIWFLVAYRPPHKSGESVTRFEQRCEMTLLATTGQPAFRIETLEKELPPPSYTAETLTALRTRHPEHDFHLILGGDSIVDLPKWYAPTRVVTQAGLVGVARPGFAPWPPEQLAESLRLPPEAVRLQWVNCPLIALASRELRQRVAEGKTIRYLVPRAVEEFIRERGLYRPPVLAE